MSVERKAYDLVVLGGGPAGIVGATTAAALGKTVALVDSHQELGGAGANTGTVPSKTLRETSLALSGGKSRNLYGVDLSLRREATVVDFLRHERNVKMGLNATLARQLQANKVDVYYGVGTFENAHTVRVRKTDAEKGVPPVTEHEVLLAGDHILIATGSAPVRPAIFPFNRPEVYDSDTILELDRLPKTLAVIGAGVIGSEYACTFAALGTQVHVLDGRGVFLPFLDGEISRALAKAMARNGIVFHWNEPVRSCDAGKPEGVCLTLSSGATLRVAAVLVAAGRKSNTENLNLSVAGIAAGDRGIIQVDEHFRTKVQHIYAAGDVIGFPALASTGMQQARIAVRHAFNVRLPSHILQVLPTGIYTIPEVGMVGETEQTLHRNNVQYVVGRGPYKSNARGRIIGDCDGMLKLLFRREDMKLLGVHVLGEQATELVHVGMMAMLAGSTAEVFDEACFNIPTLGELYKFATLDAIMRASHEPHP
jgi:NAD(P) transhydrogenase